jgi:phosphoadenosine phosphosulfate reductase
VTSAQDASLSTKRSAEELKVLARYAAIDLSGASAQEIIRWASDVFGSRVVLTQSMANTVLAHLVNVVAPEIDVIFLDTGVHFPETIETRDRLVATTNLPIINLMPTLTLDEQAAQHGPELWKTNPDLCCAIRKVAPMEQALENYDAWISGMRHATAEHRKSRKVVEYDEARNVIKVSPLLHWSEEQLLRYTLENDVVVNPLMYEGYPSIGCAPCTRRVEPGEDTRAGRWSGLGKTECGLHQ